jgi:DNA mismatch endonuclease (patch repair protein)
MKKIKVPRYNKATGFKTTSKYSNILSKIKSTNSKAEVKLRKAIWNYGLRYRLNIKQLPGKPDIVLRKYKLAIFVDGDFWHGYNWHLRKPKVKTNRKYWVPKIERNMQRDKEVNTLLHSEGWKVLRFWEHQIHNDLNSCLKIIIEKINIASGLFQSCP